MKKIAQLAKSAHLSKQQSVFQKYSSSKFSSISLKHELKGEIIKNIISEEI